MSKFKTIQPSSEVSNSETVKSKPATYVTYDEICATARRGVLIDFANQRAYQLRKEKIRAENADVQVIKWTNMEEDKLIRPESSRLVKEHKSALGGAHLYQISVFGLTAVSAMSTAALLYYGLCHRRSFLIFVPVTTVVTWRLWSIVERASVEEKYIDNAVLMRRMRKNNPANLLRGNNDNDKPAKTDKVSHDTAELM